MKLFLDDWEMFVLLLSVKIWLESNDLPIIIVSVKGIVEEMVIHIGDRTNYNLFAHVAQYFDNRCNIV